MLPTPTRARRFGVIITASLALGMIAQSATAQDPADTPSSDASTEASGDPASVPEPTLPPSDEPVPGLPVPDDAGVVHSWALAPGDGTQQSGERPNLSYELAPGGRVDDLVTLYNFSNVPLTFGLYATDAFNNDDGSFNLLAADQAPTDVGTWVTLPAESITVPAGKQATFPITIAVPMDASPGDHVGALLASSAALGTGPDNAVVTLDRRTGTRLYVRVAGQLRSELAVEDLETEYTAAANPLGGGAVVSYRIVNRGNVRLAGTQQVSVAGPLGALRKRLAVEDVPELLPGESIDVTRSFDGVAATGLMFAEVELDPRSPVGEDDLDGGTRSTSARAVPYSVLAGLLLLILARLARRSYVRHRNAGRVDDGAEAGMVIVPDEVIEADQHRQPTR